MTTTVLWIDFKEATDGSPLPEDILKVDYENHCYWVKNPEYQPKPIETDAP